MASQPPPKPWERRIPGAAMSAPVNYRSTDFAPPGPSTSGLSGLAGPPVLTRMVPPVPPRPVQSIQSYRPSYGSFPGSSHNPYGSSSLYGGAYSPYSPYSGGYGMGGGLGGGLGGSLGYSRFGQTGGEDVAPSRFVQQAEESSRGAFQSIESIVQAFTSVSMMMDATFSAVYNSFRAVLDVANHLTRLRMHFTKVLSAFALVRTLRYLYRRIQRMLGLRRDGEVEDLWADSEGAVLATRGAGAAMEDPRAGAVKSWPIFLFLAVVLGGPYLIWKLLSSAQGPEESVTNWASGEDDHVVARAEYDFTAASEEELSLNAGDMLNLANILGKRILPCSPSEPHSSCQLFWPFWLEMWNPLSVVVSLNNYFVEISINIVICCSCVIITFLIGGGGTYNYDISKMSDLRKLYNSKVYEADRMRRPLEGMSFQVGVLSHSGVRVTLADGSQWLVHKGDGFGISTQTVVVAARHMSRDWKTYL